MSTAPWCRPPQFSYHVSSVKGVSFLLFRFIPFNLLISCCRLGLDSGVLHWNLYNEQSWFSGGFWRRPRHVIIIYWIYSFLLVLLLLLWLWTITVGLSFVRLQLTASCPASEADSGHLWGFQPVPPPQLRTAENDPRPSPPMVPHFTHHSSWSLVFLLLCLFFRFEMKSTLSLIHVIIKLITINLA